METFLNEVAKNITEKYTNFSNITIVFPSRRAGLYFRNQFSKYLKSPCWSPEILSLTDFMTKYSGIEIKDLLTLSFELYNIYLKYFPNETFDEFIYWGEIIIKDFDIIDRYLVDSSRIFKHIKDFKQIEVEFPTELPEEYKKFWQSIESENTTEKQNFLKTWEALGKIYIDYSNYLKSKKIGYEGLAFRELYNSLNKGKEIHKGKIIFAGFYALSKSEEEIILHLIGNGKAELYFDIDNYYLENEYHEAGYFLKKSIERFKSFIEKNKLDEKEFIHLIDSKSLTAKDKQISIIGAPLQTGMVKALGSLLGNFLINNKQEELNNTAVILPDESNILQVLYSIPDEIKEFNVTIGFPFKDTQLYSLLLLLKDLHKNSIKKDSRTLFYYKDIERILLHPYIRFSDISIVFRIINLINQKNIIYSSIIEDEEISEILNDSMKEEMVEIISRIFVNISSDVVHFFEYLDSIILSIIRRIEKSVDEYYKKFQFEYISQFYIEFERLKQLITKFKFQLTFETALNIIINICKKMHIPFTGEPIKGLQVMGLLESRNLDFENVFILSLNEGILPSTSYEYSFIPYSIRKTFGLPVYEDKSKIESYFFYRLIQRAKNVFLLYDTEISNYSKEKSRFILQIEKDIFKSHKLNHQILSFKIPPIQIKPIVVEKTEPVLDILNAISHLSPTSLITYIDCKLKFYFEIVIELEELETAKEELDEALIGSIFHKIMELIYEPYIGKIINKDEIKSLLDSKFFEDKFNQVFNDAINTISSQYKKNIYFEYSGKNNVIKNVIKEFVKNTLKVDSNITPIEILELEKKIEFPFKMKLFNNSDKTIILKGFVDRIDRINNQVRIIDYKTGSKNFKALKPDEYNEFFNKIFSDTKYKDSFQIFYYLYVLSKLMERENFIAAIIYPRENNNNYQPLKEEYITDEEKNNFYIKLNELLSEIYNPTIPFTQTNDEEKCAYCSYKNICHR
ncbi:MAG: PD-(D/E)XK nuclease family protein [Ignavibacteria bacterium]|nr:PD-(D/E)XK nuclease family protein [Ignavibacteria bacterium]